MMPVPYRCCAVFCIFLTLAPQLLHAQTVTNQSQDHSAILNALNSEVSQPVLSAKDSHRILQTAVKALQDAASKKTLEEARSALPPAARKALTAQDFSALSKFKLEHVSDSEIRIHGQGVSVRLEISDLVSGKFVLNGTPLNLNDFSSRTEVREKIDKILQATHSPTSSHAVFEIISSAYAEIILTMMGLVIADVLFLGLGALISDTYSCTPAFALINKTEDMKYVCYDDKRNFQRDPSSFTSSKSKAFLDRIESMKYLTLNSAKGTTQVNTQKIENDFSWRTPWSKFMEKSSCGNAELIGQLSDLSKCLNELKAMATTKAKGQSQTTLKSKPQKSNASETAAGSSTDSANGSAAH